MAIGFRPIWFWSLFQAAFFFVNLAPIRAPLVDVAAQCQFFPLSDGAPVRQKLRVRHDHQIGFAQFVETVAQARKQ
jgi:hypothetical protein